MRRVAQDRSTMTYFARQLGEALPAVLALVFVLVAAAVSSGAVEVVAAVIGVGGMFAGYAYREHSPRGRDRRTRDERFLASLGDGERSVLQRSRMVPLVIAFAAAVVAGFDARIFALTALVSFVVVHAAVAGWLYGRRRGGGLSSV